MKYIIAFFCLLTAATVLAQKESFDILSYTPPAEWEKETLKTVVAYSRIDGGSWAQIKVYASTASKGTVDADNESEWQELVARPHNITSLAEKADAVTDGEWSVVSRSGVWQFNGQNVASIVTTYSNGSRCVSVVLNATAQPYLEDYKNFISGVDIVYDNNSQENNSPVITNTAAGNTAPVTAKKNGYTFNTTRFDDGWTSTVKEDWVEVNKPGIKLLIHYPNSVTDAYYSDKSQGDMQAWNTLVAPRYTNIRNLTDRGLQAWQSVTFLTADGQETGSGKNVYIVLYYKSYSQGGGRFLEVVADSKAIFEKEFGNKYIDKSSWDYLEQEKSWDKLAQFQWRNKFSIAAVDLPGKWKSVSSSYLQYYYVQTGAAAGATATAIANEFTFLKNNRYQSVFNSASGVVGNQQFTTVKYIGQSIVSDWSIKLTNRFKGATETYEAFFEAVKGGRILQLRDTNNTTISLVKE